MRTIETTLYKFDELSDKAQEDAIKWITDNWHDLYNWGDDNAESLEKFCKFFGCTSDYSYDLYGRSWAKITINSDYTLEQGLSDLLPDNKGFIFKSCPFTGYYMDEVLLQPIRDYLDNPTDDDIQSLMDKSASAWLDACIQDVEYAYSDEGIRDMIEANDYEFTKDGTPC